MRATAEMTRRGWILFASMCVIWGLPYLLIRVAVRDLCPAMLVFCRTGIAAALLLPLAAIRGEVRPALTRWRGVLAFSAIEMALPWLLLARAEQHLSSSLTGLLIAAVPLVGAVLMRFTGARERLGFANAAGIFLGLVGVAALVGLDLGGRASARSARWGPWPSATPSVRSSSRAGSPTCPRSASSPSRWQLPRSATRRSQRSASLPPGRRGT